MPNIYGYNNYALLKKKLYAFSDVTCLLLNIKINIR